MSHRHEGKMPVIVIDRIKMQLPKYKHFSFCFLTTATIHLFSIIFPVYSWPLVKVPGSGIAFILFV